jgi:hypothetical protein
MGIGLSALWVSRRQMAGRRLSGADVGLLVSHRDSQTVPKPTADVVLVLNLDVTEGCLQGE